MHWASWSDFWAMGGYGLYVWGSFAVTMVAVIAEVMLLRRHNRQAIVQLKRIKRWEEQ